MTTKLISMNRFFTLLLAASCLTAVGQCDEIFISEYIEGLANNKALEIYNPTDVAVDLSDYRLERYSNGATTPEDNQKVDLSGTLEANSVVVIALDKRDPNGVDFEEPVWDGLLDAADLWLCPNYNVNNTMYYNGNDALVLRKISTNAPVDIFGKIGEDPGPTGWAEMTQNHTLIRKPNVTVGDTDALDDFLVVDQWDGTLWSNDSLNYTLDGVFVNLGVHTCECGNAVNCPEDEDEDGICDDEDDCVGEYDVCGICNGPGEIYGCGCQECDCDDIDEDGICDYNDDCVGVEDVCGVCYGPGAIYDCGCSDIPSGACDCEGTQLDAIGVCGGDCSVDSDSDGICDDEDDCIDVNQNGLCDEDEDIDNCNQDSDNDGLADCNDDCPFGDFDNDGLCDADDPCVGVVDVLGICGGNCTLDNDSNGVCDDQEVYGCAYELADNYDVNVTRDDGSCVFPCEGVVNTNVFDWDGDYVVTVTDFLMMLSVYGDTDVDLDGVWDSGDDCVDTNACNYANDPSEPCAYIDVLGVCGGGCEGDEDNDGICDDIDTCIGIEDACGVCNGPGPTEVVIEDITILYDSVYAEQIDQWFVFEVGQDTTFSYTCAPFFGACGDPVSYQGYDYATVLIGDQCWFAENLRSENYENGDAIPSNLSVSDWQTTNSGAVAVYGEDAGCNNNSPDIDACDPAQSLEEYGRLYNWHAVDDARGLCPSGWHVPTDGEWMTMEMALGMSEAEANDTGYRGTDQGTQMKTTYGWYNGGNGTDSSGFSGLPGAYRDYINGYFGNAGYDALWWSSSPNGSYAWYRYLDFEYENVYRFNTNQRYGFSVRCVRDAE